MGTLQEDLEGIDTIEDKVVNNKVARFAYTETAYSENLADGVEEYDVNKEQNIPIGSASVMKVNETVLNRGYRAQASSITRMLMNHFLGRISYNLNKVNDVVSSFIKTVKSHLGSANGIATLDETGRIPYTQLPESAMEFMGTWDASTNTPTLTDGTGRNGNFYVVSVAGTQTFGGVVIRFNENDRVIYNGATSSWTKLSSGDVRTVNNIEPDATGNITLDAPDVNAIKTINNISPNKETGNINLESLSINGQYFNGSAPVSVDTMNMLYGGTGATNAKGAEFNITSGMEYQPSDFTDTTKITCVQESPSISNGRFFYSSASYLWNYIKGKISSVLGLTASNYGGTALKATNAEQATRATTANKVQNALTINGQSFDGSSPVTVDTPNTDTKVTQNISTGNNNYPILATATANKSSSSTETAIFSTLLSMNPATGNMTGWSNGGACAMCLTDASVQDKSITLPGLTLVTGMTVTVFFLHGNTADIPRLNVNVKGAKSIKVYSNGSKKAVTRDWDAGTSMTLIFDGADFVVLGNPIVMSTLSLTTNYIKYANGLLIQWGTTSITDNKLTQQPIKSYSSTSSYFLLATSQSDSDRWAIGVKYSASIIKLAITSNGGYHQNGPVDWFTIGY